MCACENYSRGGLSRYIQKEFEEYYEPKLELSEVEPEGAVMPPRKLFNWSFFFLASLLTITLSLALGIAIYVITVPEVQPTKIIVEQSVEETKAPQELPAPKLSEKIRNGRLKVVVEPWGEVFVDGRRIGLTPFSALKIPEGTHTIRIVNERLGKEKALKVVISANQDTLVRHRF